MAEHVHIASDPRIFVFGSNLRGIHGAGAANYAAVQLGAQQGLGEGPMGRRYFGDEPRCYALPTCSAPGRPLALAEVAFYTGRFLEYAEVVLEIMPEVRFFVSAVGCGSAGFSEVQIAPLFALAPSNCDLPPGWRISHGAQQVA